MIIVTALVIETNIDGYRNHTGLETDIAIMTVLAIETDIHLSGIELGIKCKELILGALSTLVSSTRRLSRLSLVFCVAVFPWLGTLCRIMTFLVTVETSDMTQIFASRAGNVAWGYRHRRLG